MDRGLSSREWWLTEVAEKAGKKVEQKCKAVEFVVVVVEGMAD